MAAVAVVGAGALGQCDGVRDAWRAAAAQVAGDHSRVHVALGWGNTVVGAGARLAQLGWQAHAWTLSAPLVALSAAWNRLAWVERDESAAADTLVLWHHWHDTSDAARAERLPLPAGTRVREMASTAQTTWLVTDAGHVFVAGDLSLLLDGCVYFIWYILAPSQPSSLLAGVSGQGWRSGRAFDAPGARGGAGCGAHCAAGLRPPACRHALRRGRRLYPGAGQVRCVSAFSLSPIALTVRSAAATASSATAPRTP